MKVLGVLLLVLLAAAASEATQCKVELANADLTTFNKVDNTVHLPCFYRIASLRFPLNMTTGKFLGLDVLARNTLPSNGSYYVREVRHLVFILTYRPRNKKFKKGPRTTFSITADDIWENEGSGNNPWPYGDEVVWQNLTFRFLWNRWHGSATFVPPIPGVEVIYRAYFFTIFQLLHPGVTVIVPDNTPELSFDTHPEHYSLCLSPTSSDVYKKTAHQQRMKPVTLVTLYLAFLQKRTRRIDKHPLCRKAKKLVKNCINHPALAIKYCGFLLNDPDVVKCLQKAKLDPMQQFVNCLRWVCCLKRGKCLKLHAVIKQNKCKSPHIFQKIKCSKKKLKKANKLQPK